MERKTMFKIVFFFKRIKIENIKNQYLFTWSSIFAISYAQFQPKPFIFFFELSI